MKEKYKYKKLIYLLANYLIILIIIFMPITKGCLEIPDNDYNKCDNCVSILYKICIYNCGSKPSNSCIGQCSIHRLSLKNLCKSKKGILIDCYGDYGDCYGTGCEDCISCANQMYVRCISPCHGSDDKNCIDQCHDEYYTLLYTCYSLHDPCMSC